MPVLFEVLGSEVDEKASKTLYIVHTDVFCEINTSSLNGSKFLSLHTITLVQRRL